MRRRPPAEPPEFDKRHLEELTSEAGLGYRWLGAVLGHQPDDTEAGDLLTLPRTGLFDSAVDELVELSRVNRTVLLCVEESPDRCSRSGVIAVALRNRGVRVVHILGDASLRPDQPRLPLEDPT